MEHDDKLVSQNGMDHWGWADAPTRLHREYAKLDTDSGEAITFCQLTERGYLTRLIWGIAATVGIHIDFV